MLIEIGEKVHVVVRRSFETELRRHFIGEIKAANGSTARIDGYAKVFDKNKNTFIKKPSVRTTIMDLSDNGYWVNILPRDVNISELKYIYDNEKKLTLSDGKSFALDINEFGAIR